MQDQVNKSYTDLEELAFELGYNYLSSSFGDTDTFREAPNLQEQLKFIFNDDEWIEKAAHRIKNNERVRNIMVVGAGTSADTYRCIPLASEIMDELSAKYRANIKKVPFLDEKYEQERKEILDITRETELSFENYLYLLSNFFVKQQSLRKDIEEMTNFRYAPSLFNEIIAHLLKHSFLDVVINFNFEETLDQAIEEEVGKKNYHFILSDGHCVNESDIMVDGRLKIPVYIKPHGTFSHKSTLRFTHRHYFDLPDDIRSMLEMLISGKRGNGKEIQRVNIIFIGFSYGSLEFMEIVDKSLPLNSHIYNLNISNISEPEKKFRRFASRVCQEGRLKDAIRSSEENKLIETFYLPRIKNILLETSSKNSDPPNRLTSSLSRLFSQIWRIAHGKFENYYKPRSIGRHEVISYLFYDPSLSSQQSDSLSIYDRVKRREEIASRFEKSPKYFRDRVLVEIALALIRNNGIIDIVELLNGRTGFFYSKYLDCWSAGKIRLKHTIYDFINQFHGTKGNEFIYSRNVFRINLMEDVFCDPALKKITENWKQLGERFYEEIEAFVKKFLHIAGHFSNWERIESGNRKEMYLKNTLPAIVLFRLFSSELLSNDFKRRFLLKYKEQVCNGKEYTTKDIPPGVSDKSMLFELFRIFEKSTGTHYFTINTRYNDAAHYLWESYERSKTLHTNISLLYSFRKLFTNGSWDMLFCVHETASNFNFLQTMHAAEKEHGTGKTVFEQLAGEHKHAIIICSYEAVKQLYPNMTLENGLKEAHIRHISNQHKWNPAQITLLFMHFGQHNHHLNLFLKSIDKETRESLFGAKPMPVLLDVTLNEVPKEQDTKMCSFIPEGGLYTHRQGFSSSVDPLMIGTGRNTDDVKIRLQDYDKMISLFFTYICRALSFEGHYKDQNNIKSRPTFLNIAEPASYIIWDDLGENIFEQQKAAFLYKVHSYLRSFYNEDGVGID